MAFSQGCSDPFPDGDISLLYGILSERVSKPRMLFVTSGTFTGNLDFDKDGNGINDADKICYDEKNTNFGFLPGPGTEYKAMIVDDNKQRRACQFGDCTTTNQNLNWVLAPGTTYARMDTAGASPTILFTTNSAGIIPSGTTIQNRIHPESLTYWTGPDSQWTTLGACTNFWNNPTTLNIGVYGSSDYLTSQAWSVTFPGPCNVLRHIVCVQQSSL